MTAWQKSVCRTSARLRVRLSRRRSRCRRVRPARRHRRSLPPSSALKRRAPSWRTRFDWGVCRDAHLLLCIPRNTRLYGVGSPAQQFSAELAAVTVTVCGVFQMLPSKNLNNATVHLSLQGATFLSAATAADFQLGNRHTERLHRQRRHLHQAMAATRQATTRRLIALSHSTGVRRFSARASSP